MPCEAALLASEGRKPKTQPASSERRPGGPKRTPDERGMGNREPPGHSVD